MASIALFGTSADPPTAGHRTILTWLADHYDHVLVWASDNPFKSHQTPLEHRAQMLQLLIDEIEPPRQNLGLHQDLSSPRALITVERARQAYPDADFTLTIGSDLVDQLPRWYQIETLLHQVKLLIVPRPGYAITDDRLAALRQIGAQITVADLAVPAVSSTAYREAGDPEIVPPPVEAYIHREHLYECEDAIPENLLTHP
ncbi:MAG: nicotinate-nucleotide adenylyltransferase [Elainella sp. Prado103]|jgi:nicotinate-nucleotide adenylyltransferase|nr:nicotinate-nucleotide adenylyltransferase [Elainella sp. Prado103]